MNGPMTWKLPDPVPRSQSTFPAHHSMHSLHTPARPEESKSVRPVTISPAVIAEIGVMTKHRSHCLDKMPHENRWENRQSIGRLCLESTAPAAIAAAPHGDS